MNVRYMVENGERLIQEGDKEEGLALLQTAYDHIYKMNPERRQDLEAICCYITHLKNGEVLLIHCGKDDAHPLFPGTLEERRRLCFECQQWCLEHIEEWKSKKPPKN